MQKSLKELLEAHFFQEDGWISTVVNPFTEADFQAGRRGSHFASVCSLRCELLKAQRPELLIQRDFTEIPEIDEELLYGCLWHLTATMPSNLKQPLGSIESS